MQKIVTSNLLILIAVVIILSCQREHVLSLAQDPVNKAVPSFNTVITTLKPQSNRASYSNTVIGTLVVGGWAVTFGTARMGTGRGRSPPRPLLTVPNVTAHPSTASVSTSCYSMWLYNCLWSLKGFKEVGDVSIEAG